MMDRVFIYWDDSNIFISARQVAAEREGEKCVSECGYTSGICLNLPAADEKSSTP